MEVRLPIDDPTPDGDEVATVARTYDGGVSVTQGIVEKVMAQDFPTVAALGIAAYAHRLSRIIYTDGFQVFWLDRLPDLPGYTLCTLDPPQTVLDKNGLNLSITYLTGPAAARRAEEVRRLIPPGEVHN